MDIHDSARQQIAQNLAERVRALGDRIPPAEVPIASSAGELILQYPAPAANATLEEVKAHFPAPDGAFVLTNRALYYRDPRGIVYSLPLQAFRRWRQKRSDAHPYLSPQLQQRILEIDVRLTDGSHYLIEVGKVFARQVRKAGRIRRSW